MEWAEIKRRLVKEGTSVQVLADLEAVPYKTMYNRIMAHQVKDGVTYLTPENTKGMKKAKAISDTKQKQAKEKEKAAGLPEEMRGQIPAEMVKALAESEKIPEDVPKLPEGYEVEDETIEELNQLYFQCKQLAEKYQKQAEDWRRIMETCASWSNAKGRKLPEVQ